MEGTRKVKYHPSAKNVSKISCDAAHKDGSPGTFGFIDCEGKTLRLVGYGVSKWSISALYHEVECLLIAVIYAKTRKYIQVIFVTDCLDAVSLVSGERSVDGLGSKEKEVVVLLRNMLKTCRMDYLFLWNDRAVNGLADTTASRRKIVARQIPGEAYYLTEQNPSTRSEFMNYRFDHMIQCQDDAWEEVEIRKNIYK